MPALQTGGLLATPLAKLLAALVVLAAVVFVGRILLNIAWKLILIAAAVVGAVYVVSVVL